MSRVLDQLAMAEEITRLRAALDAMTKERDGAKADADNWFQKCVDAEAALDAARAKALEDAAKAAHDRLYPKNAQDDWTEFAKVHAAAAIEVAAAIRAMKEPTK